MLDPQWRTPVTLAGQDTLLGFWQAMSRLSPDARVVRAPDITAAVFPACAPLNNAILTLPASRGPGTVSAAGTLFADAGIDSWALWVPSRATGLGVADTVEELPGLTRDTTTLVMTTTLTATLRSHEGVVRTSITAAALADGEPVPVGELPEGDDHAELSGWVSVFDGAAVAGAWSFQQGTDCGVYAVETLPRWRRRGHARMLVEHLLAEAYHRGARTATLQSTAMGQPLYESLGFRPVGRYEEWVPDVISDDKEDRSFQCVFC